MNRLSRNDVSEMSRALERLKRIVGSDDASMTDENKHTIVAMRFDIEAVNMVYRKLRVVNNCFNLDAVSRCSALVFR